MTKIEVEIKLSKKLQYELNRINKEISNARKNNNLLRKRLRDDDKKHTLLARDHFKLDEENKELKLRLDGFLFHNKYFDKHKKEILVEIKPEQARVLFIHLDYEVFILNDDGSETLIDEKFIINKRLDGEFWSSNRFAIEAKTIPEVKS